MIRDNTLSTAMVMTSATTGAQRLLARATGSWGQAGRGVGRTLAVMAFPCLIESGEELEQDPNDLLAYVTGNVTPFGPMPNGEQTVMALVTATECLQHALSEANRVAAVASNGLSLVAGPTFNPPGVKYTSAPIFFIASVGPTVRANIGSVEALAAALAYNALALAVVRVMSTHAPMSRAKPVATLG